jgi:hypothetical protein
MGAGTREGGLTGEEAPVAGGVTDGSSREGFKDGAAAAEKGHGRK